MNDPIIAAFLHVSDGFSVDRVIAEPGLNACFLQECRVRGITDAPVDTNLSLLNRRKRGGFSRCQRRTVIRNQERYGFAAEMAIRAMERRYNTPLDRVLCDPELAIEFDSVAAEIAPGFTPLEYRWAALGLRKANRLKPELFGRIVPAEVFGPMVVAQVDPLSIPAEQGLYILTNRDKVLYVGEAKDLRFRLKKHLDHSDNKRLAQYIWEFGRDDLLVEYHVLPTNTATKVRKAMELELIRSRRADFNVQR